MLLCLLTLLALANNALVLGESDVEVHNGIIPEALEADSVESRSIVEFHTVDSTSKSLMTVCTTMARVANIGVFPICNAFISPTGEYKCFKNNFQTIHFQYGYGGKYLPTNICRNDVQFSNPKTSTWEFITAKDENNGIGGLITPFPSIKTTTALFLGYNYTVYIKCSTIPNVQFFLFGQVLAIITISPSDAPELCLALNLSTNAPSYKPTLYPTSIPCWLVNTTNSNDIHTPICQIWRQDNSKAICYRQYDPRYYEPVLQLSYSEGVISDAECISAVTFPSKHTPWEYVDRIDDMSGIGGFVTPNHSIRILTSYNDSINPSLQQMYVYITCSGNGESLAFDSFWCSIYCSIITLSPLDEPELCNALATASFVPTHRPTRRPTRRPSFPTSIPSFKPSHSPTSVTFAPTPKPTVRPTRSPTTASKPSVRPSNTPTTVTFSPTYKPTKRPSGITSRTSSPTCKTFHPTRRHRCSKKPSTKPTH